MKNALNNQVGMLGDTFLWLVANLKQGGIYFIKQASGNEIMPSVYDGCNFALAQKGTAIAIIINLKITVGKYNNHL